MNKDGYGTFSGETCNRPIVIYGVGVIDCNGVINQLVVSAHCLCNLGRSCIIHSGADKYCNKCEYNNF